MKSFYLILLIGALLVSWKIKSSERPSDDLVPDDHLVRHERGLVEAAFDYSASPSTQATKKCALINAVVNETATESEEQTWVVDTAIPTRARRYYNMEGYDTVFVCGNAVGKSNETDSTSYRYMGCSVADLTGAVANPSVVNWSSTDPDTTVTDALSTRLYNAFEQSMASLPSSIEGIDLLDTCQYLDKKLLFVTDEFEMLIENALEETGLKANIQNRGYILDAVSHWNTGSYVGTYISSVS
ncbi:unnamed protein product [Cylindrotheca closterium]|uniref:Alkaline phosphatase n=1 Tax=Cylindrotheca closterium TaxID=2856 RepID=A0AAD2FQA1_9STRA|nr:unnamed protein product [Cylindrotheca closterium]